MHAHESKQIIDFEKMYQEGMMLLEKANSNTEGDAAYADAVDCFQKALQAGLSYQKFSKECVAALMKFHGSRNWSPVTARYIRTQNTVAILLLNAAEHKCAEAQYEIGKLLQSGYDPKIQQSTDEKASAQWQIWREDRGNIPYQERNQRALPWYQEAAEAGNAEAQYKIGSLYFFGEGGLTSSETQAIAFFSKAAQQNHLKAHHQLHMISAPEEKGGYTGCEKEKNAVTAAKWALQVIAQDSTEYAASYLVREYVAGLTLPYNPVKAIQIFSQCIESIDYRPGSILEEFNTTFIRHFPTTLPSVLSYTQACLFFYSGMIYDKLITKIETPPPELRWRDTEETPVDDELLSQVQIIVKNNFEFMMRSKSALFKSLMRSIPSSQREIFISNFLSEHKATIASELTIQNRNREHDIAINTMLPSVLVKKITMYMADESALFIEFFSDCLTELEKDLALLKENPGTPEAKCCDALLTKLKSFKKLLFDPMQCDEMYLSSLHELLIFVKSEKEHCSVDYRNTIRCLDKAIKMIGEYLFPYLHKSGAYGFFANSLKSTAPLSKVEISASFDKIKNSL